MKRFFTRLGMAFLAMSLAGCGTVTVYQSPISKFQLAVNSADSGIRTYLLSVDDIVAKRHLYEKALTNTNWTIDDFKEGSISSAAIQVRIQALDTISSYANALNAVAESKDVSNLQQAAKVFGTNVNNLYGTLGKMAGDSTPLNIQEPVTKLVTSVGTWLVENAQRNELEKAIIDGATSVDSIIAQLAVDLPKFAAVVSVNENGILERKLDIYNKIKTSTSPKDMDALISQLITDYHNMRALQSSDVGPLLTDMESAHKSLVAFARSKKTSKDLADLSARIDLFFSHVEVFNNALSSISPLSTSK
jgi:hypothetical protein